MIENNLVSVIVPVYNVEPYVEECIRSIINQSYKNIEILVIDDGSTDNSLKICENIASEDNRIVLIRQSNCGVVKARGQGIKKAKGKYAVFVDSDDWIEYNMIEELVCNIKDVDMVASGINLEASKGNIVKRYEDLEPGIYDIDYILKSLLYDSSKKKFQQLIYSMWNKLYKLDILRKVYFDIDPEITFGEDSILVCKYLLKCQNIKVVDKCFYNYRFRETSAIHSHKEDRLIVTNKIYFSLKKDFQEHNLKEELLYQLEVWIKKIVFWAVNEGMGFTRSEKITRFIVNTSGLDNKKIIIYGAGAMGKEAYNQLNEFGYNVILWVDNLWKEYQAQGYNVFSPDEINNKEFDTILIAVYNENLAKDIKKILMNKGIECNKIIWNKSIALY